MYVFEHPPNPPPMLVCVSFLRVFQNFWLMLHYYLWITFSAPNLKSDSDSDFSPSNSEEEEEEDGDKDEEEKGETSETQLKTPSKTSTTASALYKTPAKKSKKASEVGFCWWFVLLLMNMEHLLCGYCLYHFTLQKLCQNATVKQVEH